MTRGTSTPPWPAKLALPLAAWLMLAAFQALAGCAGPRPAQPPDMQYGLEECTACRMIVSEPRHAAAVVYDDGRIERFDDVGCLLRHLTEAAPQWPPPPDAQIWVHGSDSQWLDARQAHFLYDPGVTTPMGYGWLAFGEPRPGDGLLRFEELPAAVSMSRSMSQKSR